MKIANGTWVLTALMMAPIIGIELLDPNPAGNRGFLIEGWWTMPLIAVVITPCVWWALVVRPSKTGLPRGILSGVVSAALILLIPSVEMIGEVFRSAPRDRGFGAAIVFAAIGFFWPWGLALGSVFGAIAMAVQRRTSPAARGPFHAQ